MVLTVMMGRRAKCIDGINPTIYHHKNSHSHMIKSHDWLVQLTPTDGGGGLGDNVELLDVDQIQWFASELQVQDWVKYQSDLGDCES